MFLKQRGALTGLMVRLATRATKRMDRAPSAKGIAREGVELVENGRFAEADAALADGLAAFPDDPRLLAAYAACAHNSGRYDEAVGRWKRLRAACPNHQTAWSGIAANEREQGHVDEAWETIEEALRRFPRDIGVLAEAGRVADRRGDHVAALALWKRLRDRRKVHPDWWSAYIQNLIFLNDLDQAEAEIALASRRHPEHRGILAARGFLASARADWDGALSVWRLYLAGNPDDQTGWEHLGRAMTAKRLAEMEAEGGGPIMAPAEVPRVVDRAVRSLLLGFESLGKDCEFGMVQRRYGAEPFGLLRWTSVTLESLLGALESRFAGIGSPETTQLFVINGHYSTGDRRWGLLTQTFVPEGQKERGAFFETSCHRLAFLAEKISDDLAAGEKIFVYKSDSIELEALQDLHARLKAFGPVRLLYVTVANGDPSAAPFRGAAGEAKMIAPDLYVGFISEMGNIKGIWDIAFDDWIAICRQVSARLAVQT